jgi:ABC-type glycerol-3-phosphate transport system substrate-binding protein
MDQHRIRCLHRAVAAAMVMLACFGLPAAQAQTLKFIVPSGATSEGSRLYLNLVREFERGESGVRIEFVPLSSWDEVVSSVKELHAHGRNAGLFVAEVSETLELENMGLIVPFEDVLQAHGGNLSEFLAPLTREFLGNSYCLSKKFCGPPFLRSMPVALYNLDQLRSAGIDSAHLPETWQETEVLLGKLQKRLQQEPFCLGGDWYDYLFEAAVRQAGGSLFDGARVTLATREASEALHYWKRLKDLKLLRRSNNWKATLNGFIAGYYPVTYYSSGGMEAVRANARFAWMADMLPKKRNHGVAVGGGNLYISANLSYDQQDVALKLARFLFRPSVQARISAATGFFPTVDAAFSEVELKERYASEEAFVRVRQQLQYAKPKLMSVDNLKVRNILKKAIDRTLDDGVAPEVALRGAQAEVDKLLGQ